MNDISFINQTDKKIEEMKVLEELINFAVSYEKLDNVIFNIVFIDDNQMHKLNKQYRGVDKTTDVLSFAFEDNEDLKEEVRMLGEIYISLDKAYEQAVSYGHSNLRELSFLMIHGFLHLLGYDHMEDQEEKEMFDRQEVILNEFGIKR
ncbi:MAG TPA: rRNA maturation RNase YbeY [Mollicutes bacterium]|jgi:probable rRNA maturation factor|nr:rRNA maturation RNase YbeY [Mollicutes bacterium]